MNDYNILKQDFYTLLYYYLNNTFNHQYVQYKKFMLALHLDNKCDFQFKDNLFYLQQNIYASVMVLIDPFSLYENYQEADYDAIRTLFKKILASISLNNKNVYISYSVKGQIKDKSSIDRTLQMNYIKQELDIIRPEIILGFGQNISRILLDKDCPLNTPSLYEYSSYPLLLGSHPVDVFYNQTLKKKLWEFLKYSKKHLK